MGGRSRHSTGHLDMFLWDMYGLLSENYISLCEASILEILNRRYATDLILIIRHGLRRLFICAFYLIGKEVFEKHVLRFKKLL